MVRYQVNDAAPATVADTSAAVDRRKADRPWTASRTPAATAPKPRVTTRVANGGSDTEWKEF
jgi:hypothetical protein